MLRFADIALGALERDVLEVLWTRGPSNPIEVHTALGAARGICVHTVQSALKRLFEKGLLSRQKVSHAYVYGTRVSRADLQRQLIEEIATQFGDDTGHSLFAAFLDLAEEHGEESLKRLEAMIAKRLERRS